MPDLDLTRSGDDRRRYEVEGIGELRLEGLLGRRAEARADGAQWSFARRGVARTTVEATDVTGALVGSFGPRRLKRGGELRWGGQAFELRPASRWKERYALAQGDRELAVLDGKGWGRRPVRISVDEPRAVEPGLLLFAGFVVRGLAEDASAAASGVTAG